MRAFVVVIILSIFPLELWAQNQTITSFSKAKQQLQDIHKQNGKTFYCGCAFSGAKPDWSSCGFKPRKDTKRASRIEWEHVVPASQFGKSFSAWTKGHSDCVDTKGRSYKGRKCAEKTNQTFNFMQADLYNLQPAIGEVNGLRSNYSFGELSGEKREFGSCDIEIRNKIAEPATSVRGDIARTYFYMETVYPGRHILDKRTRRMMEKWNKDDPVSAWECRRAEIIKKIQKNDNSILSKACSNLSAGYSDKPSKQAAQDEIQRQPASKRLKQRPITKLPSKASDRSINQDRKGSFSSQGQEASESDF